MNTNIQSSHRSICLVKTPLSTLPKCSTLSHWLTSFYDCVTVRATLSLSLSLIPCKVVSLSFSLFSNAIIKARAYLSLNHLCHTNPSFGFFAQCSPLSLYLLVQHIPSFYTPIVFGSFSLSHTIVIFLVSLSSIQFSNLALFLFHVYHEIALSFSLPKFHTSFFHLLSWFSLSLLFPNLSHHWGFLYFFSLSLFICNSDYPLSLSSSEVFCLSLTFVRK